MRTTLLLMLLLGSTAVGAVDLQTGLNGTWWNPQQDGQGFVVHVIPEADQLFVAWFTFEPEGGSQMWMTGSGSLSAQPVELTLLRPRGGALTAAQPAPDLDSWGAATMTFASCTSAVFSYQSADGATSGEINIERLTPSVGCEEG